MKPKVLLNKYAKLLLVIAVWFCVWPFTPGLLSWSIGSMLFADGNNALITSIVFATCLLGLLYLTHSRFNRTLFKQDRTVWLYILPAVALLAIPLRLTGDSNLIYGLAPWLYVAMISASVVMQQYTTFGLLQSYLSKTIRPWLTIVITTGIFYLGHALFLGHNFGPAQPLNALFIISLGLLFSFVRYKAGSLHVNLALHSLFYFVFIG